MAGIDYNHHLDTLLVEDNYSVGMRGAGSLGPVDAIAFLDNQRLAVFCGLSVSGRSQLSVLTLDTNDAEILQALPRMLFKAKNPAGELVTGEVLADDARYALVTLRQHGLVPIAVESKSAGEKTFVVFDQCRRPTAVRQRAGQEPHPRRPLGRRLHRPSGVRQRAGQEQRGGHRTNRRTRTQAHLGCRNSAATNRTMV